MANLLSTVWQGSSALSAPLLWTLSTPPAAQGLGGSVTAGSPGGLLGLLCKTLTLEGMLPHRPRENTPGRCTPSAVSWRVDRTDEAPLATAGQGGPGI